MMLHGRHVCYCWFCTICVYYIHDVYYSVSVPETWAKFSNDNIQRSQSERAASRQMRNEIESVLNSCANEMWQEWNAVNVNLTKRCQESTDARNRLQTHLSKVICCLDLLYLNIKRSIIQYHTVESLNKCIQCKAKTSNFHGNSSANHLGEFKTLEKYLKLRNNILK